MDGWNFLFMHNYYHDQSTSSSGLCFFIFSDLSISMHKMQYIFLFSSRTKLIKNVFFVLYNIFSRWETAYLARPLVYYYYYHHNVQRASRSQAGHIFFIIITIRHYHYHYHRCTNSYLYIRVCLYYTMPSTMNTASNVDDNILCVIVMAWSWDQ